MGSSLYHLLGRDVSRGYDVAKSRQIFRDLVDTPAQVLLSKDTINVHLSRRAHNPLLIAAGFQDMEMTVPWLGHQTLAIKFK
ncbi:MAG: hypothetical protein KGY41_03595 [Desulfovermiculus sp.]|nr:hypothetical protein [Desulfovermiculus sp.]